MSVMQHAHQLVLAVINQEPDVACFRYGKSNRRARTEGIRVILIKMEFHKQLVLPDFNQDFGRVGGIDSHNLGKLRSIGHSVAHQSLLFVEEKIREL